jgi:hypothetical protein
MAQNRAHPTVFGCRGEYLGALTGGGGSHERTRYGLPVVFANNAQGTEDVAKLAPEAGYLLTAAFPRLTLAQAGAILTRTEGPGGGSLDNGSAFGVYSRLDLYKAAEQAAALLQEGK